MIKSVELPQVKAADPVVRQAVRPTLQYDAGGLEVFYHTLNDGTEDQSVAVVVHSFLQWDVN